MCDTTPWYLQFLIWYDIETFTNKIPWQDMTKKVVMNFIIYVVYVLKTKDHFCWFQKKVKLVSLLNFFSQEGFLRKIPGT